MLTLFMNPLVLLQTKLSEAKINGDLILLLFCLLCKLLFAPSFVLLLLM